MKLIYLASPYSHPDREVRHARFAQVSQAQAYLTAMGYHIFGPITESHTVQQEAAELGIEMSGGWDFWKDHDELMLQKCDELWVLQLDGWDKSVGVLAEIDYAHSRGMPVQYITYEDVAEEYANGRF